jgi:hypothetical protein
LQFKKIINLKKYFIMSKLSLDALKERAEAVASIELLNSISVGTENSCHPEEDVRVEYPTQAQDNTRVVKPDKIRPKM